MRRYFGREIAAYDVQTKRCDLYGQDAGYSERVMLIYDGLHYDALAVAGALPFHGPMQLNNGLVRTVRCEVLSGSSEHSQRWCCCTASQESCGTDGS